MHYVSLFLSLSSRQMEIELSDYSRYNKELLREREQQKLKLEATTREMMKERRQVRKIFKNYYVNFKNYQFFCLLLFLASFLHYFLINLQVHDLKVEIENFRCSLHATTRHIQEPKVLKEEVKDLYKKYLKDYDEVKIIKSNCRNNNNN